MPFLTHAIRSQKFLEAEVEIENFIDENGITDNMVIYSASFDKKVFETEVEVKEYLNDKFYSSDSIEDAGDSFTAQLMNSFQVDLDSTIEIEIRRGLTAKAAELRPVSLDEISFNAKLPTFDLSVKDREICLNTGLPHIIEVCRVAEGYHANYGQIKITQKDLESMEHNFREKVTGVDLAVNEDHKKNEAFAWFKDIFLSHDKQTLYAQVVWNAKGTQALSEKEYRYFSPEFRFSYTHPHTSAEHGPTLLGGALTNYPFLKMDAITELNNKQEVKVMSEKTISLADHQTQVIDLSTKINDLEKSGETSKKVITSLKDENVELSEKVSKLEKDAETKKTEAKNEKLFTENIITKAQLVALNEGKDVYDILALNTKLGETKGETKAVIEFNLSDADKVWCKQNDMTEEKFAQYNGGK